MLGQTMLSVQGAAGDSVMVFTSADKVHEFYHEQDCCESVRIDDVCGDIQDLVGFPLLVAEEVSNKESTLKADDEESCTWTFYRFATKKGFVVVRWLGVSNGYYSESVSYKMTVKEGA